MNPISTLLCSLRGTRGRGQSVISRPSRFRPTLELLEDRLTPSSSAITLGSASAYGVLGLVNAKMSTSNVTITGNVGVSQGGTLSNTGPSGITGSVEEYASGQFSSHGKTTATLIVDPNLLAKNDSDALNAAAAAAALTPTQTFGNIRTATTIIGNGGLNVIQINGNITASLTLTGTANDIFVVNVTGTCTLSGTSALAVGGGVTAAQVLYNFTAASGTITSKTHNVVNGTLLAPNCSFNFDGICNGEIISGQSISLLANAQINEVSFVGYQPTIAPTTISGFVLQDFGGSLPPSGFGGVMLTLTDATTGQVIMTTMTNPDGSYTFGDQATLLPGTYTITETVPDGGTAESASAGTLNGMTDSSNTVISGITVNSGNIGLNYDFKVFKPVSA